MTSLKTMQAAVYALNVKNGWYDGNRSFGDSIALLHSEISEMLEAFRDYGLAKHTEAPQHSEYCIEMAGDKIPDGCLCAAIGKPSDVGSELADLFIRVLDTAQRYKIDLEYEYERKMHYNHTRPYRHGGKRM